MSKRVITSLIDVLYSKRYYVLCCYGLGFGFGYINREKILELKDNKMFDKIYVEQIERKNKYMRQIKDIFEIDH
jgi:hypothetical protein